MYERNKNLCYFTTLFSKFRAVYKFVIVWVQIPALKETQANVMITSFGVFLFTETDNRARLRYVP